MYTAHTLSSYMCELGVNYRYGSVRVCHATPAALMATLLEALEGLACKLHAVTGDTCPPTNGTSGHRRSSGLGAAAVVGSSSMVDAHLFFVASCMLPERSPTAPARPWNGRMMMRSWRPCGRKHCALRSVGLRFSLFCHLASKQNQQQNVGG